MSFPIFIANDNGVPIWLKNTYSPEAVTGVTILVVAASLSLVAVIGILTAIAISSFKTNHTFIRSQLGAYFVSLVLAELVQATGSLMSARWVTLHEVHAGPFCAAQGALKNAGNVSTALWSMVIAFHTFTLIFLRVRVAPTVFYATLVIVWLYVGFNVLLGPAVLQRSERGPFWGVSGYWCWITEEYEVEQFAMEYLFMFMTAIVSVILYTLIFLRLRGNIDGTGFRLSLCRARTPWQRVANMADPQVERVGKKLLLYPVCYVVLVLPIAACRWSETYGVNVPFPVTIFADSVFLLSGVVNAVLYSSTRRVAPINTIIPSLHSRKTATVATEKATESFQSGHRDSARYTFSGRAPFLPALPTHLEEGYGNAQPMPNAQSDTQTSSPQSLNSSNLSVTEAGYPGPRVLPALPSANIGNQIMPCPELNARVAAVPEAHSRPERVGRADARSVRSGVSETHSGRSEAFDRDWI